MIEIEDFTKAFASQFDETSPEEFTPETKFKELEEWSSMLALVIIAFVDEQYNVKLTGEDIRSSTTVQDIYSKVTSKI